MPELEAIEGRLREAIDTIAAHAARLAEAVDAAIARAERAEAEVVQLGEDLSLIASANDGAGWQEEKAGLEAELARLQQALSAERATVAELRQQADTAGDAPQAVDLANVQERTAELQERLGRQEVETARLRASNDTLRETLNELREAMSGGMVDADMINSALAAELDATRAAQAADRAELDAVLAELTPLIEEKADV